MLTSVFVIVYSSLYCISVCIAVFEKKKIYRVCKYMQYNYNYIKIHVQDSNKLSCRDDQIKPQIKF